MDHLDIHLLADADGHLTDLGATALADGQLALLPASLVRHADACDTCAARVGEAALRSLEVHDRVGALAAAEASSPAAEPALRPVDAAPGPALEARDRPATAALDALAAPSALAAAAPAGGGEAVAAPVPWWALVGAAALALTGVALATRGSETAALAVSVARAAPLLVRTLMTALVQAAPELTARLERAAFMGAATLWAAGLALGWLATRGRRGRQGERS